MNKGNKIFVLIIILAVAASVWAIMAGSGKPGTSTERADSTRLRHDDNYSVGVQNAKITIVEFADFQCPACRAAEPVIKKISRDYQQDLVLVFRNFPLPGHLNALDAARAAEAAGEQRKFWEMHDILYQRQDEWASSENAKAVFAEYAGELGLDVEKFRADQASDKYNSIIQRDMSDAQALRVQSTPTFFVNGIRYEGVPTAKFEDILKSELAAK